MKQNKKYISPTPGEFPIMAWGPTAGKQMPVFSDFDNFAQCGFNVALFRGSSSISNWEQVFSEGYKFAAITGTKIIVNSSILLNDDPDIAANLINKFKDDPQTAGWMISDEPSYCRLLGITIGDTISCPPETHNEVPIETGMNRVYSRDTKHMAFFNLSTNTSESAIGNLTYPDYLSKINDIIMPPVWSYDFYPVRRDTPTHIYVISDKFYAYLEYFRAISKVSDRPFWAYCMCRENTYFPTPTEGMLRFEAFSALAYGAQGIVYYEYRYDREFEGTDVITPTNYNGEKTEIWYTVRTINQEIKRWGKVFLDCSVSVLYSAHSYETGNIIKQSIDCIDRVYAEGKGFILSKIQNGSKKYIVIVSSDPLNKQIIYVKYNQSYKVIPSRVEELGVDQSTLGSKYTLPEGGYLIIEYSE